MLHFYNTSNNHGMKALLVLLLEPSDLGVVSQLEISMEKYPAIIVSRV